MTRRRRNKPHDPAAAERHRAEREATKAEITRLTASGAAVNVDPRTGRLTGAWRMNCFNTLLPERGSEQDVGQRASIDWLEEIVRTAAGENTPERRPDFIRGTAGDHLTDTMLRAAEQLRVVETSMAPPHIRMLLALLEPDASLLTRWRAVVREKAGEANEMAQSAAVRAAALSLVWVRDNFGMLERAHEQRKAA